MRQCKGAGQDSKYGVHLLSPCDSIHCQWQGETVCVSARGLGRIASMVCIFCLRVTVYIVSGGTRQCASVHGGWAG